MKHLILLLSFVVHFNAVFCHEKQKDSTTIGYYVVIEKNGKIQPKLKTDKLAEVYAFTQIYFPYFCAEIETELKHSPYFMQIMADNSIYIEKRKIVKGKYKRLKKYHAYL